MVKVKEDMTGWIMSEHGVPDSKLIIIEQAEDYIKKNGEHEAQWLCECNCNNHDKIIVRGSNLKTGNTKSCGCIKKGRKSGINKYDLSGEYGIGYAANTGSAFYFDLEDYDKIKDYCWREKIDHNGYHSIVSSKITLHQLVFEKHCDHINRNALDNRKENLRKCTIQENSRNRNKQSNNTSGYIGITWWWRTKTWKASIGINRKQIVLGYFKKKEDAIRARLEAEAKYFGEFAPQRHLFEQYKINVEDGDTNDLS